MHIPVKILAVLISTVLGLHSDHHKARMRIPRDYAAWTRVANCESGGWRVLGYAYPDALGIDRANFEQFGTEFGDYPDGVGSLSMAARIREIRVADRLIKYYGIGIPDQSGCAAW